LQIKLFLLVHLIVSTMFTHNMKKKLNEMLQANLGGGFSSQLEISLLVATKGALTRSQVPS
jgi:hypothetical protein